MDAFEFISGCDANVLLRVLTAAKCKECGGSGERNDADVGDIGYNTWACGACEGKGWNRQAVREITSVVP